MSSKSQHQVRSPEDNLSLAPAAAAQRVVWKCLEELAVDMSSAGNSISSQPLNYCFVMDPDIYSMKSSLALGLFCWVFPCLQHFLLSGVSRQCSSTNSHETVGDSLERSSLLSKITHQKNWSNLKPDFFFPNLESPFFMALFFRFSAAVQLQLLLFRSRSRPFGRRTRRYGVRDLGRRREDLVTWGAKRRFQ